MEQVIFRDRVVLDASASEPFEIFAQLQALMCHPLSGLEERQRIANGICADIIDQQCELQPEIAITLRANFPEYRPSRNRVSLASQAEKWGEALIAGWYFLVRLNKELPANTRPHRHTDEGFWSGCGERHVSRSGKWPRRKLQSLAFTISRST